MNGELLIVDWTRRRVLRLTDETAPRCCHHGSRLSEWCHPCLDEVDAAAIDLSA